MTHRELEQYAPNRYAYFEKIVFERYLDREALAASQPGRGGLAGNVHSAAERGDRSPLPGLWNTS